MFLEDPELVYSTAIPIFNTPPPPAPSSTTRAGPQTTFSQTYLGLGRAIKNCGPWDTSRSRLESPGKALDTDPSFPPFFFLPPRKWVGVMTRPSCNHEEKGKKFLESSSVTTSQQPPTIDLLCDRKKKWPTGSRSINWLFCYMQLFCYIHYWCIAPQHTCEINTKQGQNT